MSEAILRAYAKEFDNVGYEDPATDKEIQECGDRITAELSDNYDIYSRDRGRTFLAYDAKRFGVSLAELVAAITSVEAYTGNGVLNTLFELGRVVNLVRSGVVA